MYLQAAYPRLWGKWRWRLAGWADARAKTVQPRRKSRPDTLTLSAIASPLCGKKLALQSPKKKNFGKLPPLLKAPTTCCPGHGPKSTASATHNANAIVAHVTQRNKTMLYWRRNQPQQVSHLLSAARWWGLATSSRNVAGGCRRSSNAGRTHLQPPDLQG